MKDYSRRQFLKMSGITLGGLVVLSAMPTISWLKGQAVSHAAGLPTGGYQPTDHRWAMAIEIDKCIGCRRCLNACQQENNVPADPNLNRTWLEKYTIGDNGQLSAQYIGDTELYQGVGQKTSEKGFFVPRLCNQCSNPPCVSVCPVNATYRTADGVVLIDKSRCIGCKYCIVACPYGARYLHPVTKTADKCTFCYHRITKGLKPACVNACPTGARTFADLKDQNDPVTQRILYQAYQVLKPTLGTSPNVYYKGLRDGVK